MTYAEILSTYEQLAAAVPPPVVIRMHPNDRFYFTRPLRQPDDVVALAALFGIPIEVTTDVPPRSPQIVPTWVCP